IGKNLPRRRGGAENSKKKWPGITRKTQIGKEPVGEGLEDSEIGKNLPRRDGGAENSKRSGREATRKTRIGSINPEIVGPSPHISALLWILNDRGEVKPGFLLKVVERGGVLLPRVFGDAFRIGNIDNDETGVWAFHIGNLPASLRNRYRTGFAEMSAVTVAAGKDIERVAFLGQLARIFLQPHPHLAVEIGCLRLHVRHGKCRLVGLHRLGAVFGIAHVTAVKATSCVILRRDALEAIRQRGFNMEVVLPLDSAYVRPLQRPTHPIRRTARAIVREHILLFDEEVIVFFSGVSPGIARVSQLEVRVGLAESGQTAQEHKKNQLHAEEFLHGRSPKKKNRTTGPQGKMCTSVAATPGDSRALERFEGCGRFKGRDSMATARSLPAYFRTATDCTPATSKRLRQRMFLHMTMSKTSAAASALKW